MINDDKSASQPAKYSPFICKIDFEYNWFVKCFEDAEFVIISRKVIDAENISIEFELADKQKNYDEQFDIAMECYTSKITRN